MILLPDRWHSFHQGVREDKHTSSEKKISIFVSASDCDSICALKALQAILMMSEMPFSIHLVSNAMELKSMMKKEYGSDTRDYRTAYCINCGGTLDCAALLESLGHAARQFVRVVVIDSHRPIHHSFNDDQDENCVLLHDPDSGDVPVDDIPLAQSVVESQLEGPSQRRRVLSSVENEGSQAEASTSGAHSRWQAECDEYYTRGSYYGIPASVVLFKLAHQLQLGGNYLLWMAVLGITEQLLLKRAFEDTAHYVRCLQDLESFVSTLNDSDKYQDLFGENLDSDEEDNAFDPSAMHPAISKKSAQGKITRSKEYKLLLYRHWSLLDSMIHTPELMASLCTFNEGAGRQRLEVILARAGIPLQQAQLQFRQMKVKYQYDMMPNAVDEISSFAGNIAMTYDSFTVEFTSHLTLCAADHVRIVWAHLTSRARTSCDDLSAGFWEAYKATDIRSKQVGSGLSLAMAHHRQLLQDVGLANPWVLSSDAIMQPGQGGPGYCVDLSRHDAWAATSPMIHPLAIAQFGLILQDAASHADSSGSGWRYKPLVLVGSPDAGGKCIALVLPGRRKAKKHPVDKRVILFTSHNGVWNVYGASHGLLQTAVEASQIHSAQSDFFDSAMMCLRRHDTDVFLQALTEVYDERHEAIWQHEEQVQL